MGKKYRCPYSKWEGRNLHGDDRHHCTDDDRFTRFSALEWAHISSQDSVVFFTDGAEDLLSAIQKVFAFLPFKLILDWYHLDKKCQQRLSMAMKGKAEKEYRSCKAACLVMDWQG